MRFSPAATVSSSDFGQVGDLRGSRGMFTIGSSSCAGGVVGEWKVELFFKGRLIDDC